MGGYPGIVDMSGNLGEWENACTPQGRNSRRVRSSRRLVQRSIQRARVHFAVDAGANLAILVGRLSLLFLTDSAALHADRTSGVVVESSAMEATRQSPEAELLAEVPFFQLLDNEERQFLASELDIVRFKAGDMVFTYGDPGDSLFVIRTGEVEVFFKDDTGERIVLETAATAISSASSRCSTTGRAPLRSVVTRDLEALRVDRSDLDHLLRLHPEAALEILAAMGKRHARDRGAASSHRVAQRQRRRSRTSARGS